MLVELLFPVVMLMIVLVLGGIDALAAFGNSLDTFHHAQDIHILAHERLDPGLRFAAVADKQVAFLYRDDLLRRGLIRMHLRAGLYQQLYLRPVPRDLARKIVGREVRAHYLQLRAVLLLRFPRRAAG